MSENEKIGNDPKGKQAIFTEINDRNNKLKRVDTGVWETAQTGVIYESPNQHGNFFGTIYRKYHGEIITGDSISTPNITKLISYGGRFRDDDSYSNFTSSGTHYIALYGVSGSGVVTVEAGWTVNEGWVDYTT